MDFLNEYYGKIHIILMDISKTKTTTKKVFLLLPDYVLLGGDMGLKALTMHYTFTACPAHY